MAPGSFSARSQNRLVMRADSHTSFFAPAAFDRGLFCRAFCGALLLAVGGNALSLPGKRFVGQYDFGYAIRGDRPARPAQVFDDGGGKIYFEARPNQPMPAVFAGKEPTLLVLQPEGQYFTARTSASEFTLVLGGARAVVRRGEAVLGEETVSSRADDSRLLASAESGLTAGVDYGLSSRGRPFRSAEHEQPVVFAPGSSTLRPEVLDALSALVVRIGRDTSIAAIGRNDAGAHDALATLRAEALRNALLARGVPANNIRLVDDESPGGEAHPHASALRWVTTLDLPEASATREAPAMPFDITLADRDIAVSLRRWAHASGYDVVWDVGWVAPINGAMRVEAPSFLDAVKQVVAGLRAQGYPVQAQAYTDHVVRFTASD
ncbi:TcpQ domain-containing protein [Scleromatobacter humisilvae]|uniref:TcpQ domain-containing protein n=1 Tax=Scleromatobacter humisilvae TaxID=2897159 RepID=A0A9X1YIW3_9BURK|nr:TcpQ domain-containing protein [Scleromatobacter humisilvae]MCK9686978.1 TcpQ domain-containing protein [Scleromatobacter humisilvae]